MGALFVGWASTSGGSPLRLLLTNRAFALLWAGQSLATFTTWSQRTVLLIWVYSLTRSGTAVGLVGLAEIVPVVLVAPLGGAAIDRWSRRVIMAGGMAAAVLVTLPLLALSGSGAVPTIIAVTVAINAVTQLSYNASSAVLPSLVASNDLGRANSMQSLAWGIVSVTGPAAAALLFGSVGPHGAMLALAAVYAVIVPLYAAVPALRVVGDGPAPSIAHDMLAGLRYVIRSRLLLSLTILISAVGCAFGGLSILDVVFVTRALHRPANDAGLLLSAAGVGELAGGAVMTATAARLSQHYPTLMGLAILSAGGAFAAYAASTSLPVAVIALGVASATFPPLTVSFWTLRQRHTAHAFMGRVASVASTASSAAQMISLAAVGPLTDALGVRTVIALGGAVLMASGALSLLIVRETSSVARSVDGA